MASIDTKYKIEDLLYLKELPFKLEDPTPLKSRENEELLSLVERLERESGEAQELLWDYQSQIKKVHDHDEMRELMQERDRWRSQHIAIRNKEKEWREDWELLVMESKQYRGEWRRVSEEARERRSFIHDTQYRWNELIKKRNKIGAILKARQEISRSLYHQRSGEDNRLSDLVERERKLNFRQQTEVLSRKEEQAIVDEIHFIQEQKAMYITESKDISEKLGEFQGRSDELGDEYVDLQEEIDDLYERRDKAWEEFQRMFEKAKEYALGSMEFDRKFERLKYRKEQLRAEASRVWEKWSYYREEIDGRRRMGREVALEVSHLKKILGVYKHNIGMVDNEIKLRRAAIMGTLEVKVGMSEDDVVKALLSGDIKKIEL